MRFALSGLGPRVDGSGFEVLGSRVWDLGSGVESGECLRLAVWGLAFGVVGFGVWGLGFGVWGFGVRDLGFGSGIGDVAGRWPMRGYGVGVQS